MVNTSLKNIDFLIQNKDQINDRDLEAIYNLSVKYPYSSFCHFFLYSVLKKQNWSRKRIKENCNSIS